MTPLHSPETPGLFTSERRTHPGQHQTNDRIVAPAAPGHPYGIYLHIPFCTHICPYCDFNTYSGQESRIPDYVDAACQETRIWAPRFDGREAATIFFGGGTPSLLTATRFSQLLGACRDAFNVQPDAEITIEANPNDLDEARCEALLEAGITRLSIGAQTLDRRGLRVLGRLHDTTRIGAAMAAARNAGFANLSLDLIYGWPGQTLGKWQHDLDLMLAGDVGGTVPDHLSLYNLIVEPGTPMADAVARGILAPIDDDQSADFFELAIHMLARHGWIHYEIANWASRPWQTSRHNAIYWRNGDYAGIGAGAHGHVGDQRIMNQPSPHRYIELLKAGKSPATNTEAIDARTEMGETMMLGLRLLQDGISFEAFHDRHGLSIQEAFGPIVHRLETLGLLSIGHQRVTLTHRGMLLANSVCAEFL